MRPGFLLPNRRELAVDYLARNNPVRPILFTHDPNSPCYLLDLPTEVLSVIVEWVVFSRVGPPSIQPCIWRDVFALGRTCKATYAAVNDELVWRRLNAAYIVPRYRDPALAQLPSREQLITKYGIKISQDNCLIGGNGSCTFSRDLEVRPWNHCRMFQCRELMQIQSLGLVREVVDVCRSSEHGTCLLFIDGTIVSNRADINTIGRLPAGVGRPLRIFGTPMGNFITTALGHLYYWTMVPSDVNAELLMPSKLICINEIQEQVENIYDDPTNKLYNGPDPAQNWCIKFDCEAGGYRMSYANLNLRAIGVTITGEELQRIMAIVDDGALPPALVQPPAPDA